MGRPIGPKKVHRYSVDFKLTAVRLSGMPGVQVQTVADALDIHPFMQCGCTPESATLHPSPMKHGQPDRTRCLQNRGKIPAFGRG